MLLYSTEPGSRNTVDLLFVWWNVDAIGWVISICHHSDLVRTVVNHITPGLVKERLQLSQNGIRKIAVIGGIEALHSYGNNVIYAERTIKRFHVVILWSNWFVNTFEMCVWGGVTCLPVEKVMLDGFHMHNGVLLFNEPEDLHLAFMLRVVDNKYVYRVIWKVNEKLGLHKNLD